MSEYRVEGNRHAKPADPPDLRPHLIRANSTALLGFEPSAPIARAYLKNI